MNSPGARSLGLVVICFGALSSPVRAATKPAPASLVTAAEASAVLGGDVKLTVHDMEKAYPGSVDFVYETRNGQILTVDVDPLDGPEKLANMLRDLTARDPKRREPPCSAGDKCFMDRDDLFATKGKWYIHMNAGRGNAAKVDAIARKVASRLP